MAADADGQDALAIDGVRIRSDFRAGDIGAVVRLHGVLYAEEHGFDRSFEATVAEELGGFALGFDAERSRVWVAERGGEIVGSIVMAAESERRLQLRWFLVHPYCRSMGVGRRLLDGALDFARDNGARAVFLWTLHDLDAAIRLYRLNGFELTETVTRERWGTTVTEQRYDLALA
jgi:ribosomal protein S18 acetylase RimI-like enzyme